VRGGRIVLKHVAQTDAALAARLAATRLAAVSTFNSVDEAERAVTAAFRANRGAIVKWARAANLKDTEAFVAAAPGGGAGRVLIRGAAASVPGKTIRVVLRKEAFNGKLYYVLTAYPQP
jgi:hypothetical protein